MGCFAVVPNPNPKGKPFEEAHTASPPTDLSPETLLPNSVAEVAGKVEDLGECRLLEMANPKKATQILELIAEGKSPSEVRRLTNVDFRTQARLRVAHSWALTERRKQLARDGFELAEATRQVIWQKLERLSDSQEALDEESVSKLSIAYGIFQDKSFAALGENSQRIVVEHRQGPSLEDAQAAIAAAKAAALEVNVTPEDVSNAADVETT